MLAKPPDPIAGARAEAERLSADPQQFLRGPLERLLLDAPFVDRASLLEGLQAFHAERMARIPSATTYPEAQPWVDAVIATDRELQRLTGLSDADLALYRSLHDYVTYRGFALARPLQIERCRVAYFPETDRGAVHIKNVDDPLTFWSPRPALPATQPRRPAGEFLVDDGVGSGLHLDDEPAEIFPLPGRTMLHMCRSTADALEFGRRYMPFWGGLNCVLRDHTGHAVAVEKSSRNFLETFGPGRSGAVHVSGNVARDPASPQGAYVRAKRRQYLDRFSLPDDGPDASYWANCDRAEAMLAELTDSPGPIRLADIITLFTTPWPDGLRKVALKPHAGFQGAPEYTLVTHISLIDEGGAMRWQVDAAGRAPAEPEITVAAD